MKDDEQKKHQKAFKKKRMKRPTEYTQSIYNEHFICEEEYVDGPIQHEALNQDNLYSD